MPPSRPTLHGEAWRGVVTMGWCTVAGKTMAGVTFGGEGVGRGPSASARRRRGGGGGGASRLPRGPLAEVLLAFDSEQHVTP